jgi:hypothetical protein
MVEVHSAKLDTKASNALAVLGQTFLQSLQHGEIEQRIAALEAQAKATARSQKGRR